MQQASNCCVLGTKLENKNLVFQVFTLLAQFSLTLKKRDLICKTNTNAYKVHPPIRGEEPQRPYYCSSLVYQRRVESGLHRVLQCTMEAKGQRVFHKYVSPVGSSSGEVGFCEHTLDLETLPTHSPFGYCGLEIAFDAKHIFISQDVDVMNAQK